ncbi:MAG: DUF547 domain-containing protein [Nitrospinaceae bacterium]|nr:DUF547 domain-containing protein [Nitrospinaceae bacterium]NIR57665.1 DUF547 domain-containing protein [Nitrospinaceae bacterium]NIS88140.1 DUF547 domain-containing protein [Nitrospinaceae bacterium]NIT85007.1 DUF547 domain-containing protein [Nitrospinaceae bacterium]NIU47176.1 DUF547 domain-containing protein [Nitrospinaceae bacterium]
MKNIRKQSFIPITGLVLLALLWIPALAWSFDFSGWNGLLKKHVRPVTLAGVDLLGVDYPALQKDPAWARVIEDLKSFSPSALKTPPEKLAFWINVYNIMAVKMVLDHYPVDSIKDAGSFFRPVWKKTVGIVGGQEVTLHRIEHEILRKMGEPRVHAAIVCASVSCPDLRREAFTPENLEKQLDDQLRKFLANSRKGMRVDRRQDRIYLSKIFDWFEEDFESKGGVLPYLSRYAAGKDRAYLKSGKGKIIYLDYNWDLNRRQD